jgi:hypothetical protein
LIDYRLFPKHELKEAEITREIRTYLKMRRVWHWKNIGTLGGKKGVADILGQYQGRFLAIEVKTRHGRLSDDQERFLEEAKREGGIAVCARSVEVVARALGDTKFR